MVGEKIRDLRKKLGLTQEQLAGLELTKSYVSQVELGRIRPSRNALKVMAQRLGKPLGYFLDNDDDLRTIEVLLKAARALWASHRLDEALVGLDEGRLLAERMGRDDILATIAVEMGRLEMTRHRIPEAIQHLTRALDTPGIQEQPELVIDAASVLGQAYADAGVYHQAVVRFQQSVEMARMESVSDDLAASALCRYGDFWASLGAWTSAAALYQESRQRQPDSHSPRSLAIAVRLVSTWAQTPRESEAHRLADDTAARLDAVTPDRPRRRLEVDLARGLVLLGREAEAFDRIARNLKEFLTDPSQSEELEHAVAIALQSVQSAHRRDWAEELWNRIAGWDNPLKGRVALWMACHAPAHQEAEEWLDEARKWLPADPDTRLVEAVLHRATADRGILPQVADTRVSTLCKLHFVS